MQHYSFQCHDGIVKLRGGPLNGQTRQVSRFGGLFETIDGIRHEYRPTGIPGEYRYVSDTPSYIVEAIVLEWNGVPTPIGLAEYAINGRK